MAQDIRVPLLRGVLWDIVNLRITRHDTQGARIESRNPRRKIGLTQVAIGEFYGSALHTAGWGALGWEVGHQCNNLVWAIDIRALSAANDILCDLRIEVRILCVGFHIASHSGIAFQLQHKGGKNVNADSSCFLRGSGIYAIYESHIERAANAQAFRKYSGSREHGSMRSFFIFKQGNFQSRLRKRNFLQFIEVIHLRCNIALLESVGEGKESRSRTNLGGMSSGGELLCGFNLLRNRLTEPVNVCARKIELADFFFQRHPAHQIIYADIDRLARVQIERLR